jgi:ATP-binding cassette subfamily B protein
MKRYENAGVRAITSLSMTNSANTMLFTAGLGAAMVMCAIEVKAGSKTIGDFVLINAMMLQLYQPLYFVGLAYREIRQSATDIEAMWRLLAEKPEVRDRPGAPALQVANGTIRFDNVGFAYEPGREILKGVSFEVPAGKSLAVVGPSGSGKSTIARLLFRLYDVSAGRILVDGQDISAVTQNSLRAAIGIVPQDTVLFNDTIRYNICYGRHVAEDAELRDATRVAQLDDLVRLAPCGYDTEVGERGLKLSGGEKQRVAIARTVLKDPRILVLDEATSALDTRTEKEIQRALERVASDRTTLIVAHRLSTVVGADEIVVLDEGLVAERGTHGELLARDGLYANMWRRQHESAAMLGQ